MPVVHPNSVSPFRIVNTPPARDPVCGMMVDPARAAASFERDQRTYYFCGLACFAKFRAGPVAATAVTAPEYTCPMHPEVVRRGPGAGPLCGMALEPKTVSLAEEANPELADMTRRFRIAAAITAPLLALAMTEMFDMRWHAPAWVQLLLATPVVVWCGRPIFERAWASLAHRSPNMFTLIGMGAGAAYLYSLAATVAGGLA